MAAKIKNSPKINLGNTLRSMRDSEDNYGVDDLLTKMQLEADREAMGEYHETNTSSPETPQEMTQDSRRSSSEDNEKKIKTSLYLSRSLFRRLKIYCAVQEISVTSFLSELLENTLRTAILKKGNTDE